MTQPFFSICIPQYGRTDFVLKAIESLSAQRFRDFEICISDDRSWDRRQCEIVTALEESGLEYKVCVQLKNRRYDANLRCAIDLAQGRYCLLLGNDDALVDESTLGRLYDLINAYAPCSVIVCDFQDYRSGSKANRVRLTGNKGAGAEIAVRHFRNFSFVSGVILERIAAQAIATERWDGSEMYQIFIACRIIAGGGPLVEIGEPLIRKDICLPNLSVDSYATLPRVQRWPIVERTLPLAQLGRLTADAVSPFISGIERRRLNARVLRQLLIYTYPFWLFEYRYVQSWPYAFGVALGMRPRRIAEGVELTNAGIAFVRLYYFVASLMGLITPKWIFDVGKPLLYRFAKWV